VEGEGRGRVGGKGGGGGRGGEITQALYAHMNNKKNTFEKGSIDKQPGFLQFHSLLIPVH
jgi:hypothetical protein